MNLTHIEIKDFPNGNRCYYCRMGELKAEYMTNGVSEKHMSKEEFKEMVLKAREESIILE